MLKISTRAAVKRLALLTVATVLAPATLSAQTLTWDPDSDQVNNGGAGLWDVTSSLWDDDASAPNTNWTNGADAVFGSSGATYQVDVTGGVGGVVVGNITLSSGAGGVDFVATTDNQGLTLAAGGATWDLGGREISFFNNGGNDTSLAVGTGDTLTVVGAGTFDTGERPNGANWAAAGATLDFQGTTLRGNNGSVGQFDNVILADGSTFIHERNVGQGYFNDWQLDGDVTFTNRFNRNVNLNGVVSGTGRLILEDMNGQPLALTNVNNSFSGGITVDGGDSTSRLVIQNDDGRLGAVPTSPDADYITLRNNGQLQIEGLTIDSNRGITLDNGGTIVNQNALNTYGGTITGTGGLQVGNSSGLANVLLLTGNTSDYTGGTTINQGTIRLGIDDALADGVLSIGGAGTSQFDTNGFDQQIAGLQLTPGSNNTRVIRNDSATASTLTIDVAAGETYSYAGNLVGTGDINLVKTGDGTQAFNRLTGFTTNPTSVAVDDGVLVWNAVGGANGSTVGVDGTLLGTGTFSGDVAVDGNFRAGDFATAGVPTQGVGTLNFDGNLDLLANSTTTIDFEAAGFDVLEATAANTSGILTAGGTLDLNLIDYAPVEGDVFGIFANWSGFSGSFDTINGTDLGGGFFFDTANLLNTGEVSVGFNAVPEPSSLALMVAGLGGLFLRRRRSS